jgi:hypothetical protein
MIALIDITFILFLKMSLNNFITFDNLVRGKGSNFITENNIKLLSFYITFFLKYVVKKQKQNKAITSSLYRCFIQISVPKMRSVCCPMRSV